MTKAYMSIAEYAEHRGCSRQYIGALKKNNRIKTTLLNNKQYIDVAASDQMLKQSTDPGRSAKQGPLQRALAKKKSNRGRPPKGAAPRVPERIDVDAIMIEEPEAGPADIKGEALLDAKIAHTDIQLRMARQRLLKEAGELVDARTYEIRALERAKKLTTALMAIPDRVSAVLAASDDPHEIQKILADEIRLVLKGQAEHAARSDN